MTLARAFANNKRRPKGKNGCGGKQAPYDELIEVWPRSTVEVLGPVNGERRRWLGACGHGEYGSGEGGVCKAAALFLVLDVGNLVLVVVLVLLLVECGPRPRMRSRSPIRGGEEDEDDLITTAPNGTGGTLVLR
jgi:hypothetical protein